MPEDVNDTPARQRISKGGVRKRYHISTPTVNRWVQQGKLPKPHYLWGHAYWWLDELEEHDEANTETYEEHLTHLREGTA